MSHKYIIILLLVIWLVNCTENPLSNDDDNKIEKEKISGKVILDDGTSSDGIFVWLQGFNLNTLTDENGKFEIKLPLPENQNGGSGNTGKFTLYFFMGNYQSSTIDIEFANGKILEEQDNITNSGKLRDNDTLFALFNCKGLLSEEEDTDELLLKFDRDTVKAKFLFQFDVFDNSAQVFSLRQDRVPSNHGFFRTGIIFEPVDKDHDMVLVKTSKAQLDYDALSSNSTIYWSLDSLLYKNDFEEIEYLVSPYITVDHPELPVEFWDALGREKLEFTSAYLEYPIKIKKDKIKVVKY